MLKAVSLLIAKEIGHIPISSSDCKGTNMFIGVKVQEKIEDPIPTEEKHILINFCWQNLQMVPSLEDIIIFPLVFYCQKEYQAVFLIQKVVIFVILFKLT